MFRSITNLIWGNSAEKGSTLFEILHFSLYKQDCESKENTLVYKDASLSLQNSAPQAHKFSVVFTGPSDEQVLLPINDNFFARVDAQNNIVLGSKNDVTCWFAETGRIVNEPTIKTFKLLLAQCMYEWKNKKPHTEASEAQLNALMGEMAAVVQDSLDVGYVPLGEEVFKSTGNCSLYVFDREKGVFTEKATQVTAVMHKLPISRSGSFGYALHLGTPKGRLHSQYIEPDVSEHVDRGTCSFVWCHWNNMQPLGEEETTVQTLCLRWDALEPLVAFSTAFAQFLWEVKNKEAFYKLKQEDSEYLLHSYAHPMDIDDEEPSPESESESESDTDTDRYSDARSERHLAMEPDDEQRSGSNQHLAIGYRNNRTFVSRGSSIGVFRSSSESANYASPDDDLKFVTTIKSVQSLNGKAFNPEQLLLHDQDSSLLMRSSQLDPTKIYRMDLERGKVVDEWVGNADIKLTSLLPSKKNAQITPEQTLVGLSSNALFRLDPRLPGNKVVEEEKKQYVVKSNFSCGATTSVGELAVASEKGEIRLYDKLDKRAKSLIPGFGDPIIGIDVLEDGKFIVATCRTYLLLIDAQLDDGDRTGFTKSTTKGRRPPIRLQLRPEHIAYMGNRVSFTTAHFSSASSDAHIGGIDLMDRSIVTSTGPFVVIWSLGKVVKYGKLFDYQIRKYSDTVVADDFRFIGQDDSILVTLPHHITVADKESLVKPTPNAFMRPV